MKRLRMFVLLLCCVLSGRQALAADAPVIRPFTETSMAELGQRYVNQPFVLVLWSVSCQYCMQSLSQWGKIQARYPQVPIVMVNTDTPAEQESVPSILHTNRLGKLAAYAFSDASPEKLRWSIDSKWRGELPRYYFFDATHRANAYSGMLEKQTLSAEMKRLASR